MTSTSASQTKSSWRDTWPIHPAAEMLPLMSPDELKALVEDIKKTDGLASHISRLAFFSEGGITYLLDGRNRLDAMELADLPLDECRTDAIYLFAEYGDNPYAYVISANILRRHLILTTEQKRDLIAKLLKAQSEKSDRQIAEQAKVSPTTVGTVRAEMEAKGEVSKLDTRADARGVQQPAKRTPRRTGLKKAKDGSNQATTIAKTREQPTRDVAQSAPQSGAKGATKAERRADETSAAKPLPARDDIGPNSESERQRQDHDIKRLHDEKRQLEIKIVGLESEVAELRAIKDRLASENADLLRQIEQYGKDFAELRDQFVATNDPGPIPESLDRNRSAAP
jgi:hypothetical protein